MKCPVDGETLAMSDRQGIEIDYCPTCRGVWLDRGELDKLIEREGHWVDEQLAQERSRTEARPKAAKPEKAGKAAKAAPTKKKNVTSFLQDLMEMGQG